MVPLLVTTLMAAARTLADLRAHIAGLHGELFHRIRERIRRVDVGQVVLVVAAVQRKPGGVLPRTVDRKLLVVRGALGAARHAAARADRAGDQQSELQHVAAVQRQFQYPLAIHDVLDGGAAGLHRRTYGLNLHARVHVAHFERDINLRVVAHLEQDAGLLEGLEPGVLNRDLVTADGDQREGVLSHFVSDSLPALVALDMCERNLCAGDGSALRIDDAAVNARRARLLGEGGGV